MPPGIDNIEQPIRSLLDELERLVDPHMTRLLLLAGITLFASMQLRKVTTARLKAVPTLRPKRRRLNDG